MSRKITIIGSGRVGSTIAYTLSNDAAVSEIVMIDIDKERVAGEVLDIVQGTCFRNPISIIAGDYKDAENSDIVIITSGVARKPGQTRIELAQTNVDILKSITPQIVKAAPDAFYIMVSNPVDILTYVFAKISGLPENQIIGSGAILDTARLRYFLSEKLDVSQKNIHAYVFGEHGETSFIPWSCADISGVQIDEYVEIAKLPGEKAGSVDRDEAIEYVRKSGGAIIANKGATFYAISSTVCDLCAMLFSSTDSIATVSTMIHGEYGVDDICLSTLALVGPKGIKGRIPVKLTEEETLKFRASADALKAVMKQIVL